MRLAGIIPESIVDGPGLRLVIFSQGCPHHCKGCHNPETWEPGGGKEVALRDLCKMIKKRSRQIRGITLSGGEPFLQAEELAVVAAEAKKMGLDVVTYTGYTYEKLIEFDLKGSKELLGLTDILVDGPL
jgi:anaerobic ribonucleoside-triphosphate reductase activating protein